MEAEASLQCSHSLDTELTDAIISHSCIAYELRRRARASASRDEELDLILLSQRLSRKPQKGLRVLWFVLLSKRSGREMTASGAS